MSGMHFRGLFAWLLSHRRAFCCLVALALMATLPAPGGTYLPLIGPPPLRFAKAENTGKTSWNFPATTLPPLAIETNSIPATPSTPSDNVATTAPPIKPVPAIAIAEPVNPYTNSVVQAHSANDLLVVTPEMLAGYFKPNNNTTNAANIRIIAPVSFAPPSTATIPSSQAIYRSP